MKKIRKLIWTFVFLAAVGVFAYSAWQLIKIYTEYNEGSSEYEDIRDDYRVEAETAAPAPEEVVVPEDSSVHEFPASLQIFHAPLSYLLVRQYEFDFGKLLAMNQDVKAWIVLQDTHIDYPVVQAADNDYYLRRTIEGTPNNAGSIFIDCRVSAPFGQGNTIVYGHNQRNQQMFHDLMYYTDEEYYHGHDYVNIYTPNGNYLYQVYSAYKTTDRSMTYVLSSFGTESYAEYIAYTKSTSLYDTGVPITANDSILTLSTCTNDFDDERFVIHARYIGPSTEMVP